MAAAELLNRYLNGVGLGSNYDGTYNSWGTGRTYGNCTQFTDASTFSDDFKRQLRDMMYAYWGKSKLAFHKHRADQSTDAIRNTQFWTWKIGASSIDGKIPNPLWSYQLGLQMNYIPSDPRPANWLGSCSRLASQYSLPGQSRVAWTPPLAASMTGGVGAGTIAPSATSGLNWPPASLTNIASASLLPYLTATGTPITQAPASPSNGATDTGGWANPSDTASWLVTVSGCNYLNAYSGVGANVPSARCTGGTSVGSIGPKPTSTSSPFALSSSAAASAVVVPQTTMPTETASLVVSAFA